MAGAKRKHNLVSNNVSASLTGQLRDAPCEVYSNDMRMQADREKQCSYPDVVVVCGEPQLRDGREDTLLTVQNERRVEQFTKQPDGSWLLAEAADVGELRLASTGCTLALDDICNTIK